MSYLVMECHPGYAVLLDEEGRFLKAANLRYKIGQTVYDPVLMKETPEKERHTIRWVSSGIAAIAACFLLFFGFSYYQNYVPVQKICYFIKFSFVVFFIIPHSEISLPPSFFSKLQYRSYCLLRSQQGEPSPPLASEFSFLP